MSSANSIRPLPADVIQLLETVQAPERLKRHLQLVYSVAGEVVDGLEREFPQLCVDRELVLFGASVHDIGKVKYPNELSESGNVHEEFGPLLLGQLGVSPERSRFARTHGQWQDVDQLEDLLVAVADSVWCGRRDAQLEEKLAKSVVMATGMAEWEVWERIDRLLDRIAAKADERLAWQST